MSNDVLLRYTERLYEKAATQANLDRLNRVREQLGLRPYGTFRVILADPPWPYQNWSDKAHGAARANYGCMTEDEIYGLGPVIGSWAAPDCVLLLWGTWPKLPEALETIAAWGFTFKTAAPWVKTHPDSGTIRTGVGFWWQGASEVLIVATRGKPSVERLPIQALIAGDQRQFYARPGGKHSNKPLDVYQWIEQKCDGPYMELFATQARPGWYCAGLSLGLRITERGLVKCAPVEHGLPEVR